MRDSNKTELRLHDKEGEVCNLENISPGEGNYKREGEMFRIFISVRRYFGKRCFAFLESAELLLRRSRHFLL